MLNFFGGQKFGKNLLVSTLVHTYNIPDNPLTRYEIYLWHKELFEFNFWCLSENTVSKLEKKLANFFKFQSISVLSILGCKQQRIASVHFNGHWQQNYTIIF